MYLANINGLYGLNRRSGPVYTGMFRRGRRKGKRFPVCEFRTFALVPVAGRAVISADAAIYLACASADIALRDGWDCFANHIIS
ncbi:MAG: hypothetical protein A2X48_14465 [Lentisphaerae bacterium GWF2_49_21]|nr:MAG: hypothetical protein A2X48_14465 [Lentisphaerae bacterium GWF2_49_21]